MRPPIAQPPDKAMPGPTVPQDARTRLLRVTARGATTVDAAEKAGLPKLTAWRYLDLLRREGAVHLRATEDGRGAEWWKTKTSRST